MLLGYIVRRLFWACWLVLTITFITFIIFFVVPTQPVRPVGRTEGTTIDIRQATGIHGTVFEEYGRYVWRLGHGSLGYSFRSRRDVIDIVREAAPVTASVVLGGALMWMLIAVPVGLLSALRPRSLLDKSMMTFVLIGISAHPVWIGLILSYLFGYRLHVLPISGYCELFSPSVGAECAGPVQWAYHMVLPWLTFSMLFAALYARMIRATVLEHLDEDYVRTAFAKGARTSRVLRLHVFRNALLPVVTMLGMDIGVAFGGSLFVETVYGLPGLGRIAVRALSTNDLPVILAVVLVVTLAIVMFNLLVDVLYASLDPRVRFTRRLEEGLGGARRSAAESRPESVPQSASA